MGECPGGCPVVRDGFLGSLANPPPPPQTSDISEPLLCVPIKGAKNSLILPSHGLPTCKAEMSRCQFVKACGIKDWGFKLFFFFFP